MITFDRKNVEISPIALNEFLNLQKAKGVNDHQLDYIKELMLFISQNGRFERHDLLREELNFNGIFDSVGINSLINDLEKMF